jgi:hypothetical protein
VGFVVMPAQCTGRTSGLKVGLYIPSIFINVKDSGARVEENQKGLQGAMAPWNNLLAAHFSQSSSFAESRYSRRLPLFDIPGTSSSKSCDREFCRCRALQRPGKDLRGHVRVSEMYWLDDFNPLCNDMLLLISSTTDACSERLIP